MKIYAIGNTTHQVHGHGDCGDEIHIIPENAYFGKTDFRPVFKDKTKAEDYLNSIEFNYRLLIVELELIE